MKTKYLALVTLMSASLLSGCSILPYHNDFACKLEDGYGKCISSEAAYDEAVTGADYGHEITKDGVKDDPKGSAANSAASESGQQEKTVSRSYETYRDRVYKQTAKLIEDPQTPVVKKPTVVRTLIMSYSPGLDSTIAYMPRYVYSMLEGPKFVLSQYQLNQDVQSPNFFSGGMR
ncbi:TraV family lipoprotein [Pantoea eucalypti]|uniref:TraV family lipoprotein n=1 Tax=Pantoea TaxID=53335 RepID=UPI000B7F3FFB|nr:TraV family lipoprotein [Pantoea ananatis]